MKITFINRSEKSDDKAAVELRVLGLSVDDDEALPNSVEDDSIDTNIGTKSVFPQVSLFYVIPSSQRFRECVSSFGTLLHRYLNVLIFIEHKIYMYILNNCHLYI